MTDCWECKGWDKCGGRDFYSPGELVWCRWQMMWLLYHLEKLQDSYYPTQETNYLDWPPKMGKGAKSGAYFETPCGIAAVVTERLEKTGKDGKILLLTIKALQDDSSDTLYQTYEFMDGDAKAALGFISGRWQKKSKYTDWKKQRVYRQKKKRGAENAPQ